MPNKIESDSILRDRQDHMKDSVEYSNAEYVQQLEKSSSLMPPEKPFETEAAQDKKQADTRKDVAKNNDFVQKVKEKTYEIERLDKSNEVRLHLLNLEYQKVADKLGVEALSKTDQANLRSIMDDVQDKIELYQSKLKAGAMSSLSGELELDPTDEEGNGDEGEGNVILDGLKDQVLMAAPALLRNKEEDEEEGGGEVEEKETNQ